MGKGASSQPPPAPDANALVAQQSAANSNAVKESARANSIDLQGPYGSVTYGRNADGTPNSQITSLNPLGQQALDSQQSITAGLSGAAAQRLGQLPTSPFSLSGIKYDPASYNTSAMPTFGVNSRGRSGGGYSDTGGGFGFFGGQQPQGQPSGGAQGGLPGAFGSFDGQPPMPGSGAPGAPQGSFGSFTPQGGSLSDVPYDPRSYGDVQQFNNRAGDAVYSEAMRRLQPQFDTQTRRFEQQLADRGIPVGSEAYNSAMQQMQQSQNDARLNANDRATATAGAEAQRMLGMEQGLRQTAWNENVHADQIGKGEVQQRLSNEQTLRQQMIQGMLMERQMPLQEIQSYIQAAPQIGMPNAPNMPQYNVAAPDVMGAQSLQYKAGMDAYTANQNKQAGMWQGAANLAGSGMGMYGMINAGAGSAAALAPLAMLSTKTAKHDDGPADRILERVKKMPIRTWRYLPHIDPEQTMHVGPYAEDWAEITGTGDGMSIPIIDAVGVCLQSIKELAGDVDTLRKEFRDDRASTAAAADAERRSGSRSPRGPSEDAVAAGAAA